MKTLRVVLCEKPSVARDIARYLKADSKHEGYFSSDEWAVTWAFGHLLELKDPHEYRPEWKSWKIETLPMIPDHFELRAKGDKGAKAQLSVIKDLFSKASQIVCATDAGREGELIFRYIQTYAKASRKDFKRLWISSLTNEAIAEGFQKLQEGSNFDALYRAAKCRSEADWIVGLNATRYFTTMYGEGRDLWSVGRVQTPVLAMIVERDNEIQNFKESDYWELVTKFHAVKFKHSGGRLDTLSDAETLLSKVSSAPLRILKVVAKDELVPPPFLFDLTELQKELNKRFGMSADATLKAAQSLYEKKHLTYPRTDSKFLTGDVAKELPALMQKLKPLRPEEISRIDFEKLPLGPRIVNDLKVTDHHALLPTPVVPTSRLSEDESAVYQAVLTRLIAALYPSAQKKTLAVDALAAGESFKASGSDTVDPGWEALYPKKKKSKSGTDEEEEEDLTPFQSLLAFKEGLEGPHEPEVKSLKTKPPIPYTEGTILQMMESAGRRVSDEEMRNAMKERGLGTPATRASIIETLLSRKYIARSKKSVVSTEMGRRLISLVTDRRLKSPELTGEWEAQLKQIENNTYDAQKFMDDVGLYVREIVGFGEAQVGLGPCPLCKSTVIEGKKGFGCSKWKEGCTFVLWKDFRGSTLSSAMVVQLLRTRKLTTPFMILDEEAPSFVNLTLQVDGSLQATPCAAPYATVDARGNDKDAAKSVGLCPKCKSPVVESAKTFGCSSWRQGCKFTIWKTIAKKKIGSKIATELLQKGSTELLEGFESKLGKAFAARLVIKDGDVKFEFDDKPSPESKTKDSKVR